jgi:CRP-like cAMP-binding protein
VDAVMGEAERAAAGAQLLQSLCRPVRFQPGDLMRQQGQHYRDMYLIMDGRVDVEAGHAVVTRGAGSPIGEIGFLRGCPATATVTARTPVDALVIDNPTLARLEREHPAGAADFLRRLAEIAEDRTSQNLTFTATRRAHAGADAVHVHLCSTPDMLVSAQRLRYQVYCLELGRNSPYADHDRIVIADDLDAFGHTFIAVEDGETIGTLRANVPSEGPLGALEELYGMRASRHYPSAVAVVTKFVVRKEKRRGPASLKLISAIIRYGLRQDFKECFIDSIPALLPYYKALGFTFAGPPFFHRENGPSHPMALDLVKHGPRLARDYGWQRYLALYLAAKAIRWIDGARGFPRPPRSGP